MSNNLDPDEAHILIRPDKMSGLVFVQTACTSYQQITLEDKGPKELNVSTLNN